MACPHCNGKTGFEYTLVEKAQIYEPWPDEMERQIREGNLVTDRTDLGLVSSTLPRCQDCGKRVSNNYKLTANR